ALLFARRVLVAVFVVLFTVVGLGAAFLTQPIYRATVVMAPADTENVNSLGRSSMLGEIGGLSSLVGVNLGCDDSTHQAIALLRSRQFTESFIEDGSLLQRIFDSRWDAKSGSWRKNWLHPEPPTEYAAYVVFDRQIRRVSQDSKTKLVT